MSLSPTRNDRPSPTGSSSSLHTSTVGSAITDIGFTSRHGSSRFQVPGVPSRGQKTGALRFQLGTVGTWNYYRTGSGIDRGSSNWPTNAGFSRSIHGSA